VDEPLVRVEVMVNVDSMRRGQVGEVELTPRIQSLASRGYLKIHGHVNAAAVEVLPVAPEAPEPAALPETPARRSRPSRAKPKPTATPPEASDGDSPGDPDLE